MEVALPVPLMVSPAASVAMDLFFVCPMNLQVILLRVRYQMGVLKRPALGGLFPFKDCQ